MPSTSITHLAARRRTPSHVYANKGAGFAGGSSQFLYAADPAALRLNGSSFTIALWFNATDTTHWGVALAKAGTANTLDDYYCSINYGAQARHVGFFIANGSTLYQPSDLTFAAAGAWNLWIGWVDLSGPTISHSLNNGTANSTACAAGGCNNGGQDFMLGTYGTHTTPQANYLYGSLDSVGVWKRALTAGERTQVWNNGLGLASWDIYNDPTYASLQTNLQGFWDLDESTATSRADASANSVTLTDSGSVTQVTGIR